MSPPKSKKGGEIQKRRRLLPIRGEATENAIVACEADPLVDEDAWRLARNLLLEQFEEISPVVWDMILVPRVEQEGWTRSELSVAVHALINRASSYVVQGDRKPSWAPGDLKRVTPVLRSRKWARSKIGEDTANSELIRCYRRADGVIGYGWASEVDQFVGRGVETYFDERKRMALVAYTGTTHAVAPDPGTATISGGVEHSTEYLEGVIVGLKNELEECRERLGRRQSTIDAQATVIADLYCRHESITDIAIALKALVEDIVDGKVDPAALRKNWGQD